MPKHSMLLSALRLPALSLICGPALLLGGCMGTQNRGVESVHQPVVARQDYLLDLQTVGDGLAAGETGRLDGWLGSLKLGYGDKVSVDAPYPSRGVRSDVAQTIAGYGVLVSEERPVSGAPVPPGIVRVVVSRMSASVPGCPDYSRNSSVDYNQNTSSNYGCATNSNLAAMIANPEDLVHGHGVGTADVVRSGKAIDALRKGGAAAAAGGK